MSSKPDALVTAAADASGDRLSAVAVAFEVLFRASWPEVTGAVALKTVHSAMSRADVVQLFNRVFDEAQAAFPTVCFWWKDQDSTFLGCCRRLSPAAGLPDGKHLVGLTDVSPQVAWNRQGNLYRRDDRAVLDAMTPKLNIVERQDRPDGTIWLRTSKVPFGSAAGGGTVGGFDIISEARAMALRAS